MAIDVADKSADSLPESVDTTVYTLTIEATVNGTINIVGATQAPNTITGGYFPATVVTLEAAADSGYQEDS